MDNETIGVFTCGLEFVQETLLCFYALLRVSLALKTYDFRQDSVFITKRSAKKRMNIGAMFPQGIQGHMHNFQ